MLSMFKVTFLSVLFEALPFILLGSFISSLINEFITEEQIQKFIPKNKILAVLVASFSGLLFPVCECAIIPIMRRLIKKGLPIYVAIPFMVSVPIMNPVVLFSTYIAFHGNIKFAFYRAIMGLVVAWCLGAILSLYRIKEENVLLENFKPSSCACGCNHNHHSHEHMSFNQTENGFVFSSASVHKKDDKSDGIVWGSVFKHTTSEFFDVGKLLIFGAFLSAMFKSFVPYHIIVSTGQNKILAILVMMMFAFILSLCSEADAFISRTFLGVFDTSAILSFLVLGPMIDIKNYIMLRGTFKKKFSNKLVIIIFGLVFLISFIVSFLI